MRMDGRALGSCAALVFVLVIAAPGCDSSSPTEVAPTPSPATVVFSDPAALADHQATITSLILDTYSLATAAIPVGVVRVVVSVDAPRSIPGWGLGGYALGPNEIEIVVDPEFIGLAQILPARLPHIVAHELHHAVRWRSPGPYRTLLEALVSEGLADHFGVELLSGQVPPWSRAFPEGGTEGYLDRAREDFDNAAFDFEAWFFGVGTDLPRWTGYTLGFRLVRDYLEANPGLSAAQLVDVSAQALRPD